MVGRLQDSIALVTGAGRGIGAAIAAAFAREGAIVWATDIDGAAADRVAEATKGAGARLDVREESDWRVVVDRALKTHGRLDILVNNAGVTGFEDSSSPHDPEHASLDDWRAVHRTNLDGVFLGCREAIRAMRPASKGAIVNIASRSGVVGIPGAAAYASSKAGVRNHTKTVALYCAEQGLNIRCNAILPAAILTPMWDPVLGENEVREANLKAFVSDTPMRRFGAPHEVAAIAVLLASDEAAYVTGAEFHVDGGLMAGSAASPTKT